MSKKIIYSKGEQVGSCFFIKDVPYNKHEGRKAEFQCHCGNIFIATIHSVKTQNKKSCGCLPTCCAPKHSGWGTRLYSIWNGMKDRCNNPNNVNYHRYGGKGVSYTPDWELFSNFAAWAKENGYSDNLTIDRIDSNGNYEPSNCRWTNLYVQSQNRGINKNNLSGYKGVSFCKLTNKYKASVGYNNKQKTLGRFMTAKEAALAYNAFIITNNLGHTLNEIQ